MPKTKSKKTRILGICSDVFITSAVLLEDGKVIAGAPEERFNRQKLYRGFPMQAVKYCLKEARCSLEDIDIVALGWNPGLHIKPSSMRFGQVLRWRGEHFHTVPHALLSLAKTTKVDYVEQSLKQLKNDIKIVYVTHHNSHAANAFFLSPFKESAILTIDGRGEEDTAGFFVGKGNKIEELKLVKLPHSLGLFYGAFTDFLGFAPHSDEWKVMALAARDFPQNKYYEKMKNLVSLNRDGTFELDLSYFHYYLNDRQALYAPKMVKLFGPPRIADSAITERHYEIANALQRVSEETVIHMLNWLHKKTSMENLVVNGGFFMNSVFNGKIANVTKFKNVFVSSCPDDSGTSLGAALYAYHHIGGQKKREEQAHNYYGPQFSNGEIKEALDKYKVNYKYIGDIEKYTARLIAAGKIVGWFQGRMEFGQRALGNRSILADPRDPLMKDKVNKAVKYRETFRPFAPSILEERVAEYFECDKSARVPFMEKVFLIRSQKRQIIPAVTHIDGSGRLQTVSKQTNSRFYKLISEFEQIAKVPIVLNTSFNLKGEAIVCSPTDAIRTFYSCGLDALVLSNYLVAK
ncbi:MAG: Carbamoyltransferase [Candidatus Giovannonibacteria bacterium GW2011_GWC2_44_9]|uniref:Carbamoyltransferase n=3 Tax=Candidatus Giovannoniibacteriota TaxID=1752738 RepID=A0A0G1L6K8_9BACT|nr:MAG: Carbamoyltransferase [Candidatus Giovannonibacteria bacterium GW2011_GWB1_44_23]KKT64282.1 MAG: Carbamoyltransferase [Candidatus Giovannonibacteria bacterium GW2011_GWA1_44_29]KKT83538.1 MAG: Carbamoyltransferase [Candidatus Giovannonibacteria bacterium GW2011_GWC2_44_9]KKT92009.1 MAG: carbamoyl transferase, carbamoyltransferase [Parcubacteria group bacterium GW2011_GWC1_45_13]